MNMLLWLNPLRWIMLLALCGSLTLGYFSWRSHEREIGAQPYIEQLAQIKAESARVLKIETDKANAITLALKDFKVAREKQDVINNQTIEILADKLHAIASAGRLRDPNGCGGSAQGPSVGGTENSQGNGAEAGGLLSREISELFISLTREADEVNAAYISCRADERFLRLNWPK